MAPRENQRARTRRSILDATAALLDEGRADPSIDEIADRALVSRATAYRYFESASDAVWQVVSDRSLTPPEEALAGAGDDVTERLLRVEKVVNDYLFGDPNGTRAFERAVLGRALDGSGTPDDRAARRLHYIDAALEPLAGRLSPHELELVRHALALTMGSQVVTTLLDTCRLDPAAARDVTTFALGAIVAEALRLVDARGGAPQLPEAS